MSKIYVIPQCSFRHAYVTGRRRSEEARQKAEIRIQLDRSGETRRRELAEQTRRLQAELAEQARQLARAGESIAMLEPVLDPLPADTPALERWLAQATVLKSAVAEVLPAIIEANRERERQRRLVEERREQVRRERNLGAVRQVLARLKEGCYIASYAIDEAYEKALSLHCNGRSDLTATDLQRLSDAYQTAVCREEQVESLEGGFVPEADGGLLREARRPSKLERDKLELRPYRCDRSRGHKAGFDPDKRRRWRRERRKLAA